MERPDSAARMNRAKCIVLALATGLLVAPATPLMAETSFTLARGGYVRGPLDRQEVAFVFTAHDQAQGGVFVLDTLKERGLKGGFFLTGDFIRDPQFGEIIERMVADGHYVGGHSDTHLLYASWEDPPKLLVTREEFDADLDANLRELKNIGIRPEDYRLYIPPYEHYTQEVSEWAAARSITVFNFTPGTLTQADYREDDDPRFLTADEMLETVWKRHAEDPHGLNGRIILVHIGTSPKRTREYLWARLPDFIAGLEERGYRIVRIDELLAGAGPLGEFLPQETR